MSNRTPEIERMQQDFQDYLSNVVVDTTGTTTDFITDSILSSAPLSYITAGPLGVSGPPGYPSGRESYHWSTESSMYSTATIDIDDSKETGLLIKNRWNIFVSFLRSISLMGNIFNFISGLKSIDSAQEENKKRVKYWGSKLFEPIEIHINKLLIFSRTKKGDKNKLNWIQVNAVHKIIPIGLDIWGTKGGIYQKNETPSSVDWSKSFLIFAPSQELLNAIKEFDVDICYTNAGEIKLPAVTNSKEKCKRNITL
jgi:hypothetical protein